MPEGTTETPPVKLAGKYETPEALSAGFKNIHKMVFDEEIAADEVLIGEGKRFKDAATAEAEYKRLEKVTGRLKPKKDPPKTEGVQIDDTPPTADELESLKVPEILAKAELDTADIEEQFAQHGKLTDEQYAALRKVNPALSKSVVNHIAEGLIAKAALGREAQKQIKAEAIKFVGSEAELGTLLEFGKTLAPARIKAINNMLADSATAMDALTVLKTEYAASANGKAKPLVTGTGVPGSGSGSATSKKEYGELLAAAQRGDVSARARVARTPLSTIMAWG